jgi:hypothetical protein
MPQALKLFGYGLLDVLGTGGPDSYGVSADALASLLAVHTDVQSTSWGKGKGAAASIAISWLTQSIHRSAGGGAGLDRASRRTSFPDDGLPTSPGGGPPEPEEGQPAEEEPSSKARISAVLEGAVTTVAEYELAARVLQALGERLKGAEPTEEPEPGEGAEPAGPGWRVAARASAHAALIVTGPRRWTPVRDQYTVLAEAGALLWPQFGYAPAAEQRWDGVWPAAAAAAAADRPQADGAGSSAGGLPALQDGSRLEPLRLLPQGTTLTLWPTEGLAQHGHREVPAGSGIYWMQVSAKAGGVGRDGEAIVGWVCERNWDARSQTWMPAPAGPKAAHLPPGCGVRMQQSSMATATAPRMISIQ